MIFTQILVLQLSGAKEWRHCRTKRAASCTTYEDADLEDLAARLGCVASGGCAALGHDGTGAPLADEVESAVLRVENLKGGFDATGTAYEQILAPFPLDAHTAHVYASARGRSALANHTDTTDVPVGA